MLVYINTFPSTILTLSVGTVCIFSLNLSNSVRLKEYAVRYHVHALLTHQLPSSFALS